MARAKGTRRRREALQDTEDLKAMNEAVPVATGKRATMPELQEHPKLAIGEMKPVHLRIVQHGELFRLTVNDNMPCVWQRQMAQHVAKVARRDIAQANAEHFVRMEGPDPLFRELPHLGAW